jgi:hypothetical protein
LKRYIWIVPVVILVVFASFAVSRRFGAATAQGTGATSTNNGPTAAAVTPDIVAPPPLPPVTLEYPTHGWVVGTAAINEDGTVASCWGCRRSDTFRLNVGRYQVSFYRDVRATRGYSRWVQPDTLQISSTDAYCTTADRYDDDTAIYVQCQKAGVADLTTGAVSSEYVDTPFFLFLAR